MSKENFVKRSVAADADLDDFMTPPKKPRFARSLNKVQMNGKPWREAQLLLTPTRAPCGQLGPSKCGVMREMLTLN